MNEVTEVKKKGRKRKYFTEEQRKESRKKYYTPVENPKKRGRKPLTDEERAARQNKKEMILKKAQNNELFKFTEVRKGSKTKYQFGMFVTEDMKDWLTQECNRLSIEKGMRITPSRYIRKLLTESM